MEQYAIAKRQLPNNDWKTQLARGYSDIPKGAKVKVLEREYINFYGRWVIVEYENNIYYVSKNDLEFI